jgi:hypothetical protein
VTVPPEIRSDAETAGAHGDGLGGAVETLEGDDHLIEPGDWTASLEAHQFREPRHDALAPAVLAVGRLRRHPKGLGVELDHGDLSERGG